MDNFFTILGGMGTLATENFIHSLNQKTQANKDQEYLNYIVVNHASVPDRTAFIKNPKEMDPRPYLIKDIQDMSKLCPDFFVLTCNTAHYFFDELQEVTSIPLLHMPKIAVDSIEHRYHIKKKTSIFLLGTEGSLIAEVYKKIISTAGYAYKIPNDATQKKINKLIYTDIKKNKYLNHSLFYEILNDLSMEDSEAYILLGCTELSCFFEKDGYDSNFPVIDAQNELIDYIISRQHLKKNSFFDSFLISG